MLEKINPQVFDSIQSQKILCDLLNIFRKRKTIRHFSPQTFDRDIIIKAIEIAGTAPSGANKQPWAFVIVEDDITKSLIHREAEKAEYQFYRKKAPEKWLDELKPLHTNEIKDFLLQAPYLIPVFFKNFEINGNQSRERNYYAKESTGIATGLLLASLHLAGLSTLTYTPSNRGFLGQLLNRPENETLFMVIATGIPADGATAPVISKKSIQDILEIYKNTKPRVPGILKK